MNGRGHPERGMTLVEVLVVLSCLAIVTIGISSALMVTFGRDTEATALVTAAHDAQLATLYIPDDVQSAEQVVNADLLSGATLSCTGTVSGTNVLRLTWTQSQPTSTTYRVSYRIVQQDGEFQLIRYSCEDGGAVSSLVVGHDLRDTSAVSVTVPSERRVRVQLTASNGEVTTITGVRRTPSKICVLRNEALSAASIAQDSSGRLSQAQVVSIVTDGPCSTMTLHYNRGSGDQTITFANGTATIPAATEAWPVGTYTLTITGATEDATDTFSVTAPPCSATVSPNPSTVTRLPSLNLRSAVTVTVTPNASCGSLELAYTRTAGGVEQVVPVSSGSATIPVTGPWDAGAFTLNVRDAGGGTSAGTATLTVATCTVSSISASPSSVARNASNQLTADVNVTVTVDSTTNCGAMDLLLSGAATGAVNLTTATATTYTYKLAAGTSPFTTGTVTLTARFNGTTETLTPTGSFQVTDPVVCSATLVSVSPNPPTTVRKSNGKLTDDMVFTFSLSAACSGTPTGPYVYDGSHSALCSMQSLGNSQWRCTIDKNAQSSWTTGSKSVQILLGATAAGSFTFSVT